MIVMSLRPHIPPRPVPLCPYTTLFRTKQAHCSRRGRRRESVLRKVARLTALPAPISVRGPAGLHRGAVGTGAAPHVRRPSRDGASAAQPGKSASLPARRKPIPTQPCPCKIGRAHV